MPQKASSSLRYMSRTATRLLMPEQYPRVCREGEGEGERRQREGTTDRREGTREGEGWQSNALQVHTRPRPALPTLPDPAHFHCSGHSPGCTQSRQPRHGTDAVVCRECAASVNTAHG